MGATQLTCIVCPIGCRITIESQNDVYTFSGNRCPRGAEFAQVELTAPTRSLTTTVRTIFPEMPVLPVRTAGEVPKALIPAIMRELAKVVVSERIPIGEPVVRDVLGTGCDIITTSGMF
ncbi:MAG: DUF1667 domain-containing protein [Treponema sp.]|nr:DUF1667 domain-containing protein [Treponema sp.]